MSAIHDLIAQISDPRLRERLATEWANAAKDKKFGLVFEDHLPELLPLHGAKPRKGDLVCRRQGALKDVWQVKSLNAGVATCVKPSNEAHPSEPTRAATAPVQFPVEELLVVREAMGAEGKRKGAEKAMQSGLFDAPFENLPLRDAIDFYRHERGWANRLIAGDSLLVMKKYDKARRLTKNQCSFAFSCAQLNDPPQYHKKFVDGEHS